MRYQITITGMHCAGCKNLLAMLLEENNFSQVVIDQATGNARFVSSESMSEVAKRLDALFSDQPEYAYHQLLTV